MSEREGVEAMPPRLVSTMEENVYPTDDEEQWAQCATYAAAAHAVIFPLWESGPLDSDTNGNDPWAEKVNDVIYEAAQKLEALSREEVACRPGMLEIAHAYRDAFWAERAEVTPTTCIEHYPGRGSDHFPATKAP